MPVECKYDEMINDFVIEANNVLNVIKVHLANINLNNKNINLLENLYREFHAVKSGAIFLSLYDLEKSCNSSESILLKVCDDKLKLDEGIITSLHEQIDKIGRIIESLKYSKTVEVDRSNASLKKTSNTVESKGKVKVSEEVKPNVNTVNKYEICKKEILAKAAVGNEVMEEEEFYELLDALETAGDNSSDINSAVVTKENKVEPVINNSNNENLVTVIKSDEVKSEVVKSVVDKNEVLSISPMSPAKEKVLGKYLAGGERITEIEFEKLLDELETVKVADASDEKKTNSSGSSKVGLSPLSKFFKRISLICDNLSSELGKKVSLELHGGRVEIEKKVIDELVEPLTHIIRNAIDHGIELPDEREKMGKSKAGKIVISIEYKDSYCIITTKDDGKGIDLEGLKRNAVIKGMLTEKKALTLPDEECYQLIFAPGISCKKEVSKISGRGVGMDVVKTKIIELKGSVQASSISGRGSVIIIKIPCESL